MNKLDILLELERRGKLPEDKKPLLDEARSRGLIPMSDMTPEQRQAAEQAAADVQEMLKRPENTNPGVAPHAPPDVWQTPGGQATDPALYQNFLRDRGTFDDPRAARLLGAGTGATLQGFDEMQGGINAAVPGAGTPEERYAHGREATRAATDLAREQHPTDMLASEIIGMLSIPSPAKGTSAPARIGGTAAEGASLGALYGFLGGEGAEDRAIKGSGGAVLGGAVGALTGLAGTAYQKAEDTTRLRSATKKVAAQADDTDSLFAKADAKYDELEKLGVTAGPEETRAVLAGARKTMQEAGLVSPTGNVPKGYAKALDAIELLDDYAGNYMTPIQMKNVRRAAMEAARQPGNEGRIGRRIVKAFDEVMEPLAPQIKEANAIYQRAAKSKTIEKMDEVSDLAANANYTTAGKEHALRKEYQKLAKDILNEKKSAQGWKPEEVAAINKIARGGPVENTARNIGRFAPRGVVPIASGSATPYVVASALGVPQLAPAMIAGTMAAGEAGRRVANKMQGTNADILRALVASGGKMPEVSVPASSGAMRKIIEALGLKLGSTKGAQEALPAILEALQTKGLAIPR